MTNILKLLALPFVLGIWIAEELVERVARRWSGSRLR